MNRKEYIKVLLGFTVLMNLSQICAFDNATYGYLTGIKNQSPYTVKVQTSEDNKLSSIVLNDWDLLKDGKRPGIQDIEFDVKDIKSMKLVVPWNGWDGDATIHVRVYNQDGTIRSQADITDRNGNVWVHDPKNGTDIKHIEKYKCWQQKKGSTMNPWEPSKNDPNCKTTTFYTREMLPKGDISFTLTVNADGKITE